MGCFNSFKDFGNCLGDGAKAVGNLIAPIIDSVTNVSAFGFNLGLGKLGAGINCGLFGNCQNTATSIQQQATAAQLAAQKEIELKKLEQRKKVTNYILIGGGIVTTIFVIKMIKK